MISSQEEKEYETCQWAHQAANERNGRITKFLQSVAWI